MGTLFNLKVFRQVVQGSSFTRAAEQFNISTAMANRHVSHLKNPVKAKLLYRSSRNLHLTETGKGYYRQCSCALGTLGTVAQKAADGADTPQGMLRVTMPLWFASNLVSNWLVEYHKCYPEVTPDLISDNRHVDLITKGFDLVLRVAEALSPSLIIKPLAEIRFVLLTSPDHLVKHGTPQTPEEAMHHPTILSSYTDQRNMETTHREAGGKSILMLNPAIQYDNTPMIHELIRTDADIAYQLLWSVRQDLAEGKLACLLPDYRVLTVQLNAAYVDKAFLSTKVHSLVDFLNERISAERD